MRSWYFERDCPFCTRSASSFCRHPLNFLAHAMWTKWWYHATFNLFRVHLKCFSILGSYSSKWLVNAWKITNEVRKDWKNDDVALNGAFWTHKKSGVQISFKKWNPFVTDEFPYEILIHWKRLYVLYTKCI